MLKKNFHPALYFPASILFLYMLALITSMGVMEMASWILFVSAVVFLVLYPSRRNLLKLKDFILPLSLFVWCFVGAWAQGFQGQRLEYAFGDFRWILLVGAFLVVLQVIFSQERFVAFFKRYYLWFFVIVLGLVSTYAISQYFYGHDFIRGAKHIMSTAVEVDGRAIRWRSSGFFSMPLTYSYSLGMMFSFIFPFLIQPKLFKSRSFYFLLSLVFLLGAISIVLSFSRGAWIAFFAALAAGSLLMLSARKLWSLLAVFICAFVLIYFSSEHVSSRINSIVDFSHQSNSERMLIWKSYIAMFLDHPLVGVGFNIDGYLLQDYLDQMNATVEYPGHAHNNFLQFLSTAGIVGFLLYSLTCFYFLFLNWRVYRNSKDRPQLRLVAVGFLSAQVMFHSGGLTECTFFDAEVRHMLIFLWACILYLYHCPEEWRRNLQES